MQWSVKNKDCLEPFLEFFYFKRFQKNFTILDGVVFLITISTKLYFKKSEQ